ncbi:MAG: hypothetical protein U0470_06460 [Anaerolineae bacterium]
MAGAIDRLGPPSTARPGLPDWFVVEGRLVSLADGTRVVGDLNAGARVFVTGTPNGGTIIAGTIDVADASSGRAAQPPGRRLPGPVGRPGRRPRLDDRHDAGAHHRRHEVLRRERRDRRRSGRLGARHAAAGRRARRRRRTSDTVRADSIRLLPNRPELRIAGTILRDPPAGRVGEWRRSTPTARTRSRSSCARWPWSTRARRRRGPATGCRRSSSRPRTAAGSRFRLRTDWGQ